MELIETGVFAIYLIVSRDQLNLLSPYIHNKTFFMRSYLRYQQPPILQSTYDLKHKKLNNSRTSFHDVTSKNPQIDLIKLPALNSMRRSASISTTERNTKFKLTNMYNKLQQLGADVCNTRLQAQETLNHIGFLRENLVTNELERAREDLKKQIRGLQRLIKGTQAADEQRNQQLRNDCQQLWNMTQSLRQTLFDLRIRTDCLDESMGFSSKKQ